MTDPAPPTSPPSSAIPASPPSGPASTARQPAPAASSAKMWVLPDGCAMVQPVESIGVAICRPAPEALGDKVLTALPAIVISLLALGITFWNFRYNRSKDARSRLQSIEDDYWLRKVVSPMSIEPFLKHVTQLAATLPTAANSTKDAVAEFWKSQALKQGEFSAAFQALELVDAKLVVRVCIELERIDDLLSDYCGGLQQHLYGEDVSAPDRTNTASKLIEVAVSILRSVKTHQTQVGLAL